MEDTELSTRLADRGEVVYDPATEVATSVRRQNADGYLSMFRQYARAYLRYYLLGTDLEDGYFPSSEGISTGDVYEQ